MPVVIDDQNFYRTAEDCRMIGIIRNTLFTRLKERIIPDVEYRDRRSWRLFTYPRWRPLERRRAMLTSRQK